MKIQLRGIKKMKSRKAQGTGYHKLILIILALIAAVFILIFLMSPSWRDWLANLPVFKIMLGEKKSPVMSKDEMIANLLKFYNIQEIKDGSKILVSFDYYSNYYGGKGECDNPWSSPITLSFREGFNEDINFYWNAEKNKAFARKIEGGDIYDADFFKQGFRDIEKVFRNLNEGEENKIIEILNGKNFYDFSKIISRKIKEDEKIGVILGEWQNSVSKEDERNRILSFSIIQGVLSDGKKDYLKNWINEGGVCKTNAGKYKCFFGEEVSYEGKDCIFFETGSQFCLEGKDRDCQDTCLCPENYKPGFVVSSLIFGKTWEFRITTNGYNKKCVYGPCSEEEEKEEDVTITK